MRQILLPICLLTLLASCSNSGNSSFSYPEHSYDEVKSLMIEYDKVFSISENDHYIYYYQETCHSCEEIRNEVIDFALNKYAEIYFVLASKATPHNYSFEEINLTLGSSNVDDVFVGVTPQLAKISKGKIEKNIIKNIYIEQELSYYK